MHITWIIARYSDNISTWRECLKEHVPRSEHHAVIVPKRSLLLAWLLTDLETLG